jgi:hypothetical protein
MSDGVAVTGGCLCKKVRYSAGRPPIVARYCWCRLCQYLSAGGPTVNAFFHAEDFEVSDEVRWFGGIADSGNEVSRGFCPTCGTPLFAKSSARPQFIVARVGSLDDPNLIAPGVSIWTSEAPERALIHPDLPQVERQPPPIA